MTYKQGLLDALEIVNSWAKTAEDMGQTREESILHDVRVMIEEKIADHDDGNGKKDTLKIIRNSTERHQENIDECDHCSY